MKTLSYFLFFAVPLLSAPANAIAQIVSTNGWYFFKTPMTNVFGHPFVDVEGRKEAVVGPGNTIQISGDSDIVTNESFGYSKIFESSWRKIILGDSYKDSKKVILTVESWRAKRRIFNRDKFKEFDPDTYYAIEGISSDSLRVSCKLIRDASVDSRQVEEIVKKYIKSNTVAFAIIDAAKPATSANEKAKGIVQLAKKDSSEFSIVVNNPGVIYAVKFGKSRIKAEDYFFVQDSYEVDTMIALNADTRKTLLKYAYTPARNSGIVNIYADLIRNNLNDNSPKLRIYDAYSKNIIDVINGIDIGNGLLRFDGESAYHKPYSGNKAIQINVAYNFDYDTHKSLVLIKGKNDGEYENCMYEVNSKFKIYP